MQGQRSTIGSLPETLEFDCGSTSSNATVNPPTYWSNMQNPAENHIPECILSPGEINSSYVNYINQDWQNLSGWSFGEPSSGNTQNEVNNNEQKRELGWPSSVSASAIAGPVLERRSRPANALSLDNVITSSMPMNSSSSHLVSQSLNLNASLADSGSDNSHHVEHPNLPKSSGPMNEHIPPITSSGSFMLPPESNGFLVEDADGRPGCSRDTRHVSRKRKAVERDFGQSSYVGSCSYSQNRDGIAWNTLPTQNYAGSNFSRSASAEQVNARLGLSTGNVVSESVPDTNVAGSSENFLRNCRLRINPPSQQNSISPTAFSSNSMIRNTGVSSCTSMLQRIHPVDNSLDLRSVPPVDTMTPQSQPPIVHVPALPRNAQSFRWSGGSSLTNNYSSNSVMSADRDNLPHEDGSSRSMPRNILEQPVSVPSTNLRNLFQNPAIRASTSANLSIPGNVASSRPGSNSAINPSSASPWVSPPDPQQQFPRRLAEYVRWPLFSPGSAAAGSPINNYSSLHGPATSSVLSSGVVHPRSSTLLERLGDSEHAIPPSLRSSAVAGDGSGRIVSELRNVLGLMRRGRSLRLEDVMMLNHSMFPGIADIHDRHRDMRLDVDNMSYEELLALEERIGNVSTGLNEETIMKHLKQKKYLVETGSQHEAEPCCVCQEEYKDGDNMGSLDCGHGFHYDCVKQWLTHKNLCPICKTAGLAT
ncbi:PREDICTED: probable E3 ubiquitin-protein ligase RHG1A [Lupinus angustifolius]|uniref:probable E3 ubiquitin-protein ligase RHG1A n=1 Tax=Lupinus angustifolius TaxID=3871 RepID=UPI00092EFB13|nr:PREDICTED: probable E3 ubiquitin-protein ligase RHG1A [Lupinus angustifolius]XP_019445706.1 PREDICTED: probable E3 ubiquitin-protein ligase RHG1A [Lupinus angustifolius]